MQSGKPTLSVATPTQDSIYIVDELRDATRHDVIDPMLSVATPITKSKQSQEERRDAIRHDADKPMTSVAMPVVAPQNSIYIVYMSLGKA
jgi:hypothetical protein